MGTIESIDSSSQEPVQADIKSVVDFERLESVLVITSFTPARITNQ